MKVINLKTILDNHELKLNSNSKKFAFLIKKVYQNSFQTITPSQLRGLSPPMTGPVLGQFLLNFSLFLCFFLLLKIGDDQDRRITPLGYCLLKQSLTLGQGWKSIVKR